jgi:hypothetical protein
MPAKTPKDLNDWNKENPEQKTFVSYTNDENIIRVYYCDEQGKELTAVRSFMSGEESRPHGKIYAVKIKPSDGMGECLGAYTIKQTFQTRESWGPLLYDCVMVLAGDSGLTPDRAIITPAATNVWKVYARKREAQGDVTSRPLDVDEFNRTTPDDPKDDCESLHSTLSADNPELASGSPTLDIVNRVYYNKNISTLSELENMKLIFKSGLQELKQLYESFLIDLK